MATYEIKMIFKKSADLKEIATEIDSICEETGINLLEFTGNMVLMGTEDMTCFGCTYVSLIYSTIIKTSLLDASWKDANGMVSCRKDLLEPVA